MRSSDLDFLVDVRNECRAFLHDDRVFSVEDAARWFDKERPEFWLVCRDGERLGYFRTSAKSIANRRVMAGADLHPAYRGRGLGYQSWCAFLNFQFADFGWRKVSLEVLSSNPRAFNLYQKLGFRIEGTKRSEVLRAGEWLDSIQMSMLDDEWREHPWALEPMAERALASVSASGGVR